MDTVVAIIVGVVCPTGLGCSRAVVRHLVIDGRVACIDCQQSVEDTTTSDNSTVHDVLVV
jgi:hypothetical protein